MNKPTNPEVEDQKIESYFATKPVKSSKVNKLTNEQSKQIIDQAIALVQTEYNPLTYHEYQVMMGYAVLRVMELLEETVEK